MARRYIRDLRGRFAEVGGGGKSVSVGNYTPLNSRRGVKEGPRPKPGDDVLFSGGGSDGVTRGKVDRHLGLNSYSVKDEDGKAYGPLRGQDLKRVLSEDESNVPLGKAGSGYTVERGVPDDDPRMNPAAANAVKVNSKANAPIPGVGRNRDRNTTPASSAGNRAGYNSSHGIERGISSDDPRMNPAAASAVKVDGTARERTRADAREAGLRDRKASGAARAERSGQAKVDARLNVTTSSWTKDANGRVTVTPGSATQRVDPTKPGGDPAAEKRKAQADAKRARAAARKERQNASDQGPANFQGFKMSPEQLAATEARQAKLRQDARDQAKARRQARNTPEAKAERARLQAEAENSSAIKQLREEVASGKLTVAPNTALGDKVAKLAAQAEAKRERARRRRAAAKG